jgi:glutamyl-tRNA(Gln) amidotransferase subunit E
MMVETVENEIKRQLELISKKERIKSEVRNALPDGTTEFLRPMPGADRMYPETDLPLLKVSRDMINDVKKNLPELRDDIERNLGKMGLSEEMVKLLMKQNKIDEFKELLNLLNEPMLIAKILLVFPKELASHEKKTTEEIEEILNKDILTFVVEMLRIGKISREQVKHVLERIVKGENREKAIEFKKEEGNVEEVILDLIKNKPGLSENAYMGLVMKEMKGKVNAGEVMGIIKKLMEKK